MRRTRRIMQVICFIPVSLALVAVGSDDLSFTAIYQNRDTPGPKQPDLCSSAQISTHPNTVVKGIHHGLNRGRNYRMSIDVITGSWDCQKGRMYDIPLAKTAWGGAKPWPLWRATSVCAPTNSNLSFFDIVYLKVANIKQL